jgi:hypothetical protein
MNRGPGEMEVARRREQLVGIDRLACDPRLSPIQDGSQMLVAAAIRDVSDHMRVEGEMKQARVDADRARSCDAPLAALTPTPQGAGPFLCAQQPTSASFKCSPASRH